MFAFGFLIGFIATAALVAVYVIGTKTTIVVNKPIAQIATEPSKPTK